MTDFMFAGMMGSLNESPLKRETEVSHSERELQSLYLGTRQTSEYLNSFILSIDKGVNGSEMCQMNCPTEKITLEQSRK